MSILIRAWYNKAPWLWLMWPVSLLFRLLADIRRRRQSASIASQPEVPVIVVGNIAVGGTGKTPLLIALCQHLKDRGMSPGVISRGYGARTDSYPLTVTETTSARQAGDEPVLIFSKTDCPVVVDPDRTRALQFLLEKHEVDIVISDDGLQHYRLPRRIEIAVIDGQRLFGNGLCLPAGPLREPISRLETVDFVIVNGRGEEHHPVLDHAHDMEVKPVALVNLTSGERRPIAGAPFSIGNKVQAVAAIGNPQRFFQSLESLPYPLDCFVFPDHYQYQASDFAAGKLDPNQPVVMTEKDAVKCREFASPNMWYVDINVNLPATLLTAIDAALTK